jgi:hypothetical protein
MRHQPEVVKNKPLPRLLVAVFHTGKILGLLLGRERGRKGLGVSDTEYQIKKVRENREKIGKHSHSPPPQRVIFTIYVPVACPINPRG